MTADTRQRIVDFRFGFVCGGFTATGVAGLIYGLLTWCGR